MSHVLDRLHAYLRRRPLFQRFTLFTRTILAFGFVAPGLTKIVGREFAPGIDPATPMGAYFEAFHGTGAYYAFVGLAQIIAGLLLLSRRTALLGACLYLPIILNIFVLVTATRFGVGTPITTGLMSLACLWLIVWDGHRLVPILAPRRPVVLRPTEPPVWDVLTPAGARDSLRTAVRFAFVLGFAGGLVLTLAARGLAPAGGLSGSLLAVLAAGVITLGAWAIHAIGSRNAQPA